ncbi:MAG: GGDEF domain-containing protein [Raoultibacter sp.]
MTTPIRTEQEFSDLLMGFLENVIYRPEEATLDLDLLPDGLQHLGQGLLFLAECAREQKAFGKSLMRGELDAVPPAADNVLAAPLKEIQGALRHARWQAQQVTKGDYNQRLDFMGEFGDAFNAMTEQLKEREERLCAERKVVEAQNKDLDDMNTLITEMTLDDSRFIVMVDEGAHEVIFETKTAKEFMRPDSPLRENFKNHLFHCPKEVVNHPVVWEYSVEPDSSAGIRKSLHFSITSHRIRWKNAYAIAHMIVDDTEEWDKQGRMKKLAFSDAMTGLHNRRYGMEAIAKLRDDRQSFVVAFIDIDYLKYCNDEFGHDEGDLCLISLAELLSKIASPRDICRIGGDEFLVVKKDCTEKELEDSLFALRAEFMQQAVPEGCRFKRSFSFGIQEVTPDFGRSTSELLELADRKMYTFKKVHRKSLQRIFV